jgi:hypothetical protein
MYELNAKEFLDTAQNLKALEDLIHEQVKESGSEELWKQPIRGDGALAKFIIQSFTEVMRLCDNLELPMTKSPVMRVSDQIRNNKHIPTYEGIANVLRDVNTRLSDELGTIVFVSMSVHEVNYYSPKGSLFGPEFEERFRSVGVFELSEAAKCLAVGRSTAAVFHLMRLMEIGIGAVARCLSIPDPIKPVERNWGQILKCIDEGIKRRWPTSSDKMGGDGALFGALYASLDAVKNPWRNATMHVENKYTTDEAEHIFVAVKGFMKKVASRCDENGDPKA